MRTIINSIIYRLADKLDKKHIRRFYKQQSYSAGFLGGDTTLLAIMHDTIIGSVIVSRITKQTDYWFLHALAVDEHHQKCGIASEILKRLSQVLATPSKAEISSEQQEQHIYCFAKPDLNKLYINNDYLVIAPSALPNELNLRLYSYQRKQTKLLCFTKEI